MSSKNWDDAVGRSEMLDRSCLSPMAEMKILLLATCHALHVTDAGVPTKLKLDKYISAVLRVR